MSDSGDARWLYIITVALALGVLVRSFYKIDLSIVVFIALLGLLIAWSRRSSATPIMVGITIFAFAIGIARFEIASWNEAIPYFETQLGQEIVFDGVISREPDERSSTTHLYVRTEQGMVLVFAPKGMDWQYGDRVRVTGEIEKPESFETDLGREFNYQGYLLVKGVAYITSFADLELLDEGEGNMLLSTIYTAKQSFMSRLERLIPEPQAGLSLGLLLGVKRALGEDLETDFRRAGIIHIVVLSGYNVMIVVAFILYVLGSIFGRKLSAIFGLIGIALFALLVGFGATVVRACIMASLLLLMGMTGRVYLVLRGLFVAGALMILWNPYSLVFDAGFQLSFLATLGLIVFSPYLSEKLEILPQKIGIREFVTATLATQLFVLPLLLYQVGEFSVVAVLVNVLVLPMVPIAMLLAFMAGVAAFIFWPLALVLAFFTYLSLTYIVHLAEWFANLPLAAFTVPVFPFYFVPIGYALIALLIWWLNLAPKRVLDPVSNSFPV